MKYLNKIKKICDKVSIRQIERVIKILERNLKEDRTIFVCGNGGSAATASHFVCDLMKTSGRPFMVICLNDNISLMTAIANDIDYSEAFLGQLSIAKPRDLLIVISGSGNSKNIVEVVKEANKMGMETVAFLGKGGGKVKRLVDEYILVPSDEYGPIEDFHMILVHLITEHFKSREVIV